MQFHLSTSSSQDFDSDVRDTNNVMKRQPITDSNNYFNNKPVSNNSTINNSCSANSRSTDYNRSSNINTGSTRFGDQQQYVKQKQNFWRRRWKARDLFLGILLFVVLSMLLASFYLPQVNFMTFNLLNFDSLFEQQDGYDYGLGQGMFPKGCRWRDVFQNGTQKVAYEFWDENNQEWTSETPQECFVQGERNPLDWKWHKDSPRSEVNCTDTYCLYTNLWYLNGRWFTLVDGDRPVPSWKMSRNQEIAPIHVHDAVQWPATINFRIVPGDTLWIDYIFYSHPTAIGHWGEMMFPLYSVFKKIEFSRPPQQVILLHLKRWHLMEWVRAVIAIALGVPSNSQLPPIILQHEKQSLWSQLRSPLQGLPVDEWVCFERALVIRDVYTGGKRTFQTTEDAQMFRKELYHQYGLPAPTPNPSGPPRKITFQRKSFNRRVVNEDEFVQLLQQYGDLDVVEYKFTSSFLEQLQQISQTGVFVAVHTSNLANAFFLPPGSAVIELIQQNWGWNQMDRSFKDQTDKMGDIHHFGWRARYANQTVYLNPRDNQRFKNWTFLDCSSEECVEAHTNVDVVVNLQELKEILDSRLPLVFAGASVQEAELKWPEGAD
eukprot:TRINITY_DN3394_c0_g2_i1.p1 TRINITY_DN3394_c0_g2~~TRINITY_DN3394_c0_g2_i1.p1  ORF type:complete len:602 (-),score=77.39 TRINITY_DN3394_c0_g2_i1:347-2152(-)